MIPHDFITQWRASAPWISDFQVEQDLVISRALVALFSDPVIAEALAFRGGTALYKLHITPAARYSEDIDLVQVRPGPIGDVMEAIRGALDPWLGRPQWKQTEGRVTLSYRFGSEDVPPAALKLKVEINTREHLAVHGVVCHPFAVESRWFQGIADVPTFTLDELLGTKLRALFQRKKGRDLFDLALALQHTDVRAERVVSVFQHYLAATGDRVTRAVFEENLAAKRAMPRFIDDVPPLLAHGRIWDAEAAFALVLGDLVALLPGEPWQGDGRPEAQRRGQ